MVQLERKGSLLAITSEEFTGPGGVAPAANFTGMDTLADGAKISGNPPSSDGSTVKRLLLGVMPETMSGAVPIFPMVSVCVAIPPEDTVPNESTAGATRMGTWPAAGVIPVPTSVMQIIMPLLVVNVRVAVTDVVDVGL